MNDVKDEIRREKLRYQDIAFRIFAVVGFLSSIVTIWSWLSSTQASLSALVIPTTIEIPSEIQFSEIDTPQYDLDSAIDDLNGKYCNPVEVRYDGEQVKNFFYNADKCKSSKDFFTAIEKISELAGKKLIAWDISLSNDGKNVAENIILRTPVPTSLRAADAEGNPVEVEATSSNRVFSLPNLNPKESYQIRILSSTPVPERYETEVGDPKITFSGGVASKREFIRVSGRYSGIVGFIDELPTVFQIIVIVIAALLITLIWMVPVAFLSDANEKRKAAAQV